MRLDLDVFGDVQFSRELLRWGERSMDMTPVFVEVADDFLDIERHQFDTQGGNSGGWAELADSTREYKAAAGLDPRILHATLALRESLTKATAPGAVRKITPDSVFMGTDVRSDRGFPYPAAHQNPKKGQTRRRPVELSPTDRIRWVKKLQAFLAGGSRPLW